MGYLMMNRVGYNNDRGYVLFTKYNTKQPGTNDHVIRNMVGTDE